MLETQSASIKTLLRHSETVHLFTNTYSSSKALAVIVLAQTEGDSTEEERMKVHVEL